MDKRIKVKTFLVVDYSDLENIIHEFYGNRGYEIVAAGEWNNDSSYTYEMNKEELDSWDLKQIEEVKAGKTPDYSVRTVLQDLVNNDIIPEGEYLVRVSW